MAIVHVFFDTEFTQFRDCELLSIGLVTDDDKTAYFEVADKRRHARASDFCHASVLPQFGLMPGCIVHSDVEAGERVANWLQLLPGELVLCSDFKLDRVLLDSILVAAGRREEVLDRARHLDVADIAGDNESLSAFDSYFSRADRPLQHLTRHHALLDAFALRERWLTAMSTERHSVGSGTGASTHRQR